MMAASWFRCMGQARRRTAFSLVEVLVTIAVIGLLVGILLPAIQMAREASRRIQCNNNLHQLGIALNSYTSTMGVLPPGNNGLGFSIHVMMLPYLDQKPLYDSINFSASCDPSVFNDRENLTAAMTSLSVFLCPSDSPPTANPGGWTNYAGNRGVGVQRFGYNGAFAISSEPMIGFQSITDGTSETAAMSEWLLGPGDAQTRDARRTVFQTPDGLTAPSDFDLFATECHNIDIQTAVIGDSLKGNKWLYGEFEYTLYNHTLLINDHSCSNGTATQQGAWTASSQHPGGAHVLFVDGHSRFVMATSDLTVWRAIGSRNGGEILSDSAF